MLWQTQTKPAVSLFATWGGGQTIEQFFNLKLPMRIMQLKGLTNGFDVALQQYSNKVVAQLGDKADLILPPPGLTRYKKEVAIKASKKKGGDPRDPDERRSSEINMLTTATLCIRLNTLHVSVLQFPSHCLVGWFFQHPCHTHIYSIVPPFTP
jgi:hypothetical protein